MKNIITRDFVDLKSREIKRLQELLISTSKEAESSLFGSDYLSRMNEYPRGQVYVSLYCICGVIVAWSALDLKPEPQTDSALLQIFVSPNFRRRGIATELYNHALKFNPTIKMHMLPWSVPSNNFAKKNGLCA